MQNTQPLLLEADFPRLHRSKLDTVQVNLGYLCNLSCTHCHVNAGPTRTELMDRETVDLVLSFIESNQISTLDMTGGSPEMNPNFKYMVSEAQAMGTVVMDRCNPTILMEPGYEYLPRFLADHDVVIVASMPCYQEQNVDKQRGKGVYKDSVAGLQKLNDVGYGQEDSDLVLNLIYNPDKPILPPGQEALKAEYKQALVDEHGIVFNELFVLANMPIGRFGARLLAKNQYVGYMNLLRDSFSVQNLKAVMCRTLISVDYQGYVYDCDFNQMLATPAGDKSRCHLRDLFDKQLEGSPIAIGEHCYGCTAGHGSSCGGALT